MFEIEKCCLVIVDVQGKLAQLMHEKQSLFKHIQILIKAAKILDIPILWCQQVPDALGPTIEQIAELIDSEKPINKASFSCCCDEQFNSRLKQAGKQQIILCGIEAHVCIYQTAVELKQAGFEVAVIADAVSSRTAQNKQIALEKMRSSGIDISSTEMMLLELLKTAEHPQFREIAKLIR
ncbi:MAG: hydrolase [Sedimentisphaerales bacterium]|nr:hydrolase [Sedimentisphaerales bacterium]